MKKLAVLLLLLPALLLPPLAGCGGGGEDTEGQSAADTLTRRQKDEIISDAPIPGAGAVGKALRVSDSLEARAEQHDTMHDR